MRPTVQLRALTAPPTAPGLPLSALRLRRSMAWPVGQAEAEFPTEASPPAAGEQVAILGSSDGGMTTPLFTGRVLRYQQGVWSTRLVVEEPTGPLARLRVDKVIRSGTAAQAMTDLCQQAGAVCAAAGPGALLPAYTMLSSQSALDHIRALALMSGWMLRTDVNGILHAEPPLPTPSGVAIRPVDPVVDFVAAEDPDEPAGGAFSGDGAMGARGPGAETWVLQSLDAISAGDAKPAVHFPGLKTMADVTNAAAMEAVRLKESRTRISIALAGAPPADLGSVVMLMGFQTGNGPARLVGIETTWDPDSGLLTRLDLQGIGV